MTWSLENFTSNAHSRMLQKEKKIGSWPVMSFKKSYKPTQSKISLLKKKKNISCTIVVYWINDRSNLIKSRPILISQQPIICNSMSTKQNCLNHTGAEEFLAKYLNAAQFLLHSINGYTIHHSQTSFRLIFEKKNPMILAITVTLFFLITPFLFFLILMLLAWVVSSAGLFGCLKCPFSVVSWSAFRTFSVFLSFCIVIFESEMDWSRTKTIRKCVEFETLMHGKNFEIFWKSWDQWSVIYQSNCCLFRDSPTT